MGPETSALFKVHVLPTLSKQETFGVLESKFPSVPKDILSRLLQFSFDSSSGTSQLSLRQLIRVCRRLDKFPATAEQDLFALVSNTMLLPFAPHEHQQKVKAQLLNAGIAEGKMIMLQEVARMGGGGVVEKEGDTVTIGGIVAKKRTSQRQELVSTLDIWEHFIFVFCISLSLSLSLTLSLFSCRYQIHYFLTTPITRS